MRRGARRLHREGRLWFFGAYNRQIDAPNRIIRDLNAPGAPALGSEIVAEIDRDLFSGKLTSGCGSSQRIVDVGHRGSVEQEGNIFAIAGPESTWKGVLDRAPPTRSSATKEHSARRSICARWPAATRRTRILRRWQADSVSRMTPFRRSSGPAALPGISRTPSSPAISTGWMRRSSWDPMNSRVASTGAPGQPASTDTRRRWNDQLQASHVGRP